MRNSEAHNRARQAAGPSSPASTAISSPSSSMLPLVQPTSIIPLTTTFTPPPSCTENRLTQAPPPLYFIWNNEPIPAPGQTSSDCFPEQFLRDYTSANVSSTGSSVVPAMSPLICPINYCTQMVGEDNYVACCPSGYGLANPSVTIDSKRPAYGGTCYSDFSLSSTYPVTAYNISGASQTLMWIATTSGAQAYAHPIDGWAASVPIIGCRKASSSSIFSSSSFPNSTFSTPEPSPGIGKSSSISRAAIAGAAVGGACGLAAICALFWFFLRWSRAKHQKSNSRPAIVHLQDGKDRTPEMQNSERWLYEKDAESPPIEIGSSKGPFGHAQAELSGEEKGPFEMSAAEVYELKSKSLNKADDKARVISHYDKAQR